MTAGISIETHCATIANKAVKTFVGNASNDEKKKEFRSVARALPTQIHQVGVLYTLLHQNKSETGKALSEFIRQSLPMLTGEPVPADANWQNDRTDTLINLDFYTDYELREWCLLFAGYLKKFAEAHITVPETPLQTNG